MAFDSFPLPGSERCIYPQSGKYTEVMMLGPIDFTPLNQSTWNLPHAKIWLESWKVEQSSMEQSKCREFFFAANKSRMQLQAWSSASSATAAAQWYWRMERVREIIIKSCCCFAETAQSVPRDRKYKSQCQWEATDLHGKCKYSVVVQK